MVRLDGFLRRNDALQRADQAGGFVSLVLCTEREFFAGLSAQPATERESFPEGEGGLGLMELGAMKPVLEVVDLCRAYSSTAGTVHALRGVSMRAAPGEFMAILGSSGSGKSTLLHLIAGLDIPTSGRVLIEGRSQFDLSDRERTLFRRRRLGVVFQAFNLLPSLTALENVLVPAMIEGTCSSEDEDHAREVLVMVDLGHRLDHRPQALSGGEQQRVAIARALMNKPALILADEPTGNLDSRHGEEVWRLLARLSSQEGRTVIAVTHALAGAAYADRIIVLKDGIVSGEILPREAGHATMVATRYAELAN